MVVETILSIGSPTSLGGGWSLATPRQMKISSFGDVPWMGFEFGYSRKRSGGSTKGSALLAILEQVLEHDPTMGSCLGSTDQVSSKFLLLPW